MNHLEHVANQLALQRNEALNALAKSQAQGAVLQEQLEAAREEVARLQQRLHDLAADERGPSGAVAQPDALRGD
jgi:chromosome segregation ATPase